MRKVFVCVLSTAVAIAALVGVFEGVFRMYIPFYQTLFLNHNYEGMSYIMSRSLDYRVLGTLGNPLVFSTAITLAVGFGMELEQPVLKWGLLTLIGVASFLTVSTTAAMLWLLLFLGLFMVSRRKLLLIWIGGWGAVLTGIAIAYTSPNAGNGILRLWLSEGDANNLSYTYRLQVWQWAVEHFIRAGDFATLFLGWGIKSSFSMVYGLGIGSMATLDNVYATLLLESGILGLSAYLLLCAVLVFRHRRSMYESIHWYVLIGLLVAGFSFTTIYYATFNFVWVASVVALESRYRETLEGRRSVSTTV